MSHKKDVSFLTIFCFFFCFFLQNSQENNLSESIFDKVVGLQLAALLKRDPTQVFSCEFCEFIKLFAKHLGLSVSEVKSVTSLYWAFVFEPFLFHGCNIENIERDWQLLLFFYSYYYFYLLSLLLLFSCWKSDSHLPKNIALIQLHLFALMIAL